MGAKAPDNLERVSRDDVDQAAAAFAQAPFAAADGGGGFRARPRRQTEAASSRAWA